MVYILLILLLYQTKLILSRTKLKKMPNLHCLQRFSGLRRNAKSEQETFMRRRALGSRLCPCQPRAVLIQKKSTTGSNNEQILKVQFSISDSIVTKNFESEEKQ